MITLYRNCALQLDRYKIIVHKVLVKNVKTIIATRVNMKDTASERNEHPDLIPEGGDSACWAHLVCPECGAIETDGHRTGCSFDTKRPD